MLFWIANLLGLGVAYLLGSLPTGYLAGRLLRGKRFAGALCGAA